jgi:hypothetical protein
VALGSGASVNTTRLVVSDGGVLDIGTGHVLVREGSLRAINDAVASGRNGGITRWGGPGITSAAALEDGLTTVAVRQGEDGIRVQWALNGDVNLDGRVNADDYFRIDQGFLAQAQNPAYEHGDFNYDARINADDYFVIDQAFLGQAAFAGVSGPAAAAAKPSAAVAQEGDDGVLTRSLRRQSRTARRIRK